MLTTGTVAYFAKLLITLSDKSSSRLMNLGNALMAIKSQYSESTFATSIICSSESVSITSFNLNSIGQASFPG